MNAVWSLTCTALPAWGAVLLAVAALALVAALQERRRGWWLPLLRAAAALVAVALIADPALSRGTTVLEPPPVAVVVDTSASMGTIDRHLPADRLLDWAVALGAVDGHRRSAGPRRMAAALLAFQDGLPALAAGTTAPDRARLHGQADDLDAAAAAAAGYREAETLCRESATMARMVADGGPRDGLVPLAAGIATLLPRLAGEQTAGDAALLSGWHAGNDPAAAAVDRLAGEPRGALAARLVRERLWPLLTGRGAPAAFSLADRLVAVDPASLAVGGGGTDLAAIGDLARGWAAARTPGAVVVVSDGRNHGGDPRPALRALAGRGARLVLVGVGDRGAPDEPALVDLDGPETARAGARLTLTATVRQGGPGWDVVLTADGVQVARQALTPEAGGSLRLAVDAGAPGLRRFAARVVRAGPSGMAASTAGGTGDGTHAELACPVRVADAPLHVLVVDALPRWETRALVAALESDPLVAVERRFIQGPAPVASALPAGTLRGIDAVVLGDLTPAELPTEDQARLAAFVDAGGCLIAVAGPRGMPAGFPLGPLADLLPVRAARDGATAAPGATLTLTAAGAAHPVCRLLGDAELDRRLWAALPGPAWLAGGVAPRADAEVLVAAATGPGTSVPVVVAGAAGAGRVLWCGAPDSWRWRAFERGRAHTAFWTGALRWGIAQQARGSDPRLRVALAPARIDAHGSAQLLVTSDDPRTDPHAWLLDDGGRRFPLTLVPVAGTGAGGAAQRWRAVIADADEGLHRITVEADGLHEDRDLLVRPLAARELADPTADLAALRALAGEIGATYAEPGDALDTVAALAARLTPEATTVSRTWRVTDGPWAALLLLALLGAEWALRKRQGLP